MALTHSNAARQAATDAVTALLNAGGAGKLVIKDGSAVTLVTFAINATAFGAAAATGIATANAISNVAATASGTAATFEAQNNAGTVVWSGAVGYTGATSDLTLQQLDEHISGGQTVSVSSWTYRAVPT
jgi:hypothetical protein